MHKKVTHFSINLMTFQTLSMNKTWLCWLH